MGGERKMAVGEGKSGANPGPTTQHLVGQGPCALPGVRYGIGGRTGASAPTEALQGMQWAGDRKGRPYERVTRGAVRRADVGSELSAAGGRSSEVSEWPRSKFPASAVRQRRNFGHRNRTIGPYGGLRGMCGRGIGPCGSFLTGREWYVSDFGGGG